MSDALVGGIVALAGTLLGFLGALGIRSLDIRRQEAEAKLHLVGYITTVISELAMNHTILIDRNPLKAAALKGSSSDCGRLLGQHLHNQDETRQTVVTRRSSL